MTDPKPENAGPCTIDHFVGQPEAVKVVRIGLEANWTSQYPFPSMLFSGPPGLGKSQLVRTIAAELAVPLHETLGQNVSQCAKLAGFLFRAREGEIVFIDEAQELERRAQVQLYTVLTERRISISGGPFGGEVRTFDLPRFSILAATTDAHRLTEPLRDRFDYCIPFVLYTAQELQTILANRAGQLAWSVEPTVLAGIATRARGTPRAGIRLLQSCHRIAATRDDKSINAAHLEQACRLEGIDELGLKADERQYLSHIVDAGGTARLHQLAKAMKAPPRLLSEVIEPHLIRLKLITADGKRSITPLGRDHLERHSAALQESRPSSD